MKALAAALLLAAALPAQAAAPLDAAAQQAVLRALDDEYLAQTTYTEIARRTGAERPFLNIRRAEQMHEQLLAGLLQGAGLPVPPNPYANGSKPLPDIPATAVEACQVAVAAEIENMRLYDEDLLPTVAGNPEVVAVFTKLRNDSEQRHLPAFQRCASGGMGMGMGGGMGRRHGG